MTNNISYGLRLLRKNRGLSQTGLGIAIGVSRSKISNWEIGRRELTVREAVRIANYFKVSLDQLVDPQENTAG